MLDYKGMRFGRLIVIEEAERTISDPGQRRWLCKCDCGNEKIIFHGNLQRGSTKSCGCLQNETRKACATHGHTRGRIPTPEYSAYSAMKRRCLLPTDRCYHLYGGRGITICERWINSFENFLSDMGERPSPRHSIDRIDTNGNYEPSNCRWATPKEQQNNKRSCCYIEYGGERLTITQWAERTGLKAATIRNRLGYGWSPERILTEPLGRPWKNVRSRMASSL